MQNCAAQRIGGVGRVDKGMGNRLESSQVIGNDKGFVAWQGANFTY